MDKNEAAALIGIVRHRLGTDGKGVTTLVGFHGCPLRCRYCLNPQSFDENIRVLRLTPEELFERVKVDQLYFLASGGGVTFGGGEPLLHADYIARFRQLCGDAWQICAETSLAVPSEMVETAASCIDRFLVDCKDTNDEIYRRYTGKSNALMLENLRLLTERIPPDRITVRLPLIPGFNTEDDRRRSREKLEKLGIVHFDCFSYLLPKKKIPSQTDSE